MQSSPMLSNENIKELRQLILQAFPEEDSLILFLFEEMNFDYHCKVPKDCSYEIRVFHLLRYHLNPSGEILKLISLMIDINPLSPEISQGLESICSSIKLAIKIPIVVISMTQDEACSYLQKHDNNVSDNTYIQLNKVLESLLVGQRNSDNVSITNFFLEHYSATRDGWNPYKNYGQNNSISEVIIEIVKDINNSNRTSLEIESRSEDFFSRDMNKRIRVSKELVDKGGVIIVDMMSLFNQNILKIVKDAIKDLDLANNNSLISLLILSPLDPCKLNANEILENLIRDELGIFLDRFQDRLDPMCEIRLGNLTEVRRSVRRVLMDTSRNTSIEKIKEEKRKEPLDKSISKLWRGSKSHD